ncbi:MAG: 2-keto-4-pentenoate hydratase [Alphaproteobacteria bacterium]
MAKAKTAKPVRTPIEALAKLLRDAADTGMPCVPLRHDLPAKDIAAAIAVQDTNTTYWLAAGRRLVGRKIGLTAKTVQRQLGVDQPDYGMLWADMAVGDGEDIRLSRVLQPKIEGEIAFVMARDLVTERPTAADVTRAVDYVCAAIEVVGSRIANWDIDIVDTIADNGSSGLFVLGNEKHALDGLDLRLCGMVLENRGEPASTGAGVACLGHPLNAMTWLANTMVACGRPLRAGDVILSGALGPMVAAKPGEVYEVRVSGLGSVRAAFAAEG